MNITIWQEKRFWGIVHKHTRILTCRHTYMFLIVVELSWQMSSTAIINATRFLYVWKVSFVFLYYEYIVFNMMGKFLHNANLICLRTISTHDKQQWGVTTYKLSQFISSCFKSITSIMCYDHLNTYIFENICYYQTEKLTVIHAFRLYKWIFCYNFKKNVWIQKVTNAYYVIHLVIWEFEPYKMKL